jgi:hypothetical protein
MINNLLLSADGTDDTAEDEIQQLYTVLSLVTRSILITVCVLYYRDKAHRDRIVIFVWNKPECS